MRAARYTMCGTVERYADATVMVRNAGDCVIVARGGVQRQWVMRCPDGCGETLSVNLDARSGKAWRTYERRDRWSLFPSIDRPTGCKSHFVLWHGHVLWCDFDSDNDPFEVPAIEADRILPLLAAGPANYVWLADQLDEIPWDVMTACRRLVRDGRLTEGSREQYGVFWIPDSNGASASVKAIGQ
jgi:hypothetical protein